MEDIRKTFKRHICIICTRKNINCCQIIKQQKNKIKTYKCINFNKRTD